MAGLTQGAAPYPQNVAGMVAQWMGQAGRAYRNAAATTIAGTQKIPLDKVDVGDDPGADFDVTTNHRYNCQGAGWYLAVGIVDVISNAANQYNIAAIYRGHGAGAAAVDATGNTATSYVAALNMKSLAVALLNCAAGDWIELWQLNNAILNINVGRSNTGLMVIQLN